MLESLRGRTARMGRYGLVYLLAIALYVAASLLVQGFSSRSGMHNVLLASTILAIVAAGQTLVILGAGVDLSVPWMMASAAELTASMSKGLDSNLVKVLPIVLGFALLVGFINGIGITLLEVPPIVMTLAMNVMLNGFIALEVSATAPAAAPPFVVSLAFGEILGLPVPLYLLLASVVVFTLLLTYRPFGRRLYAVGTSVLVSRLSGVRPTVVLTSAYMLSSLAAAIAGIVLLGFSGEAFNGMGDQYQFTSIAAVIVGGASILGGRGHYIGTVGGVFLLTTLNILLQVYSLGAGTIKVFYGLAILVSVWLSQADLLALVRRVRRQRERALAAE
jgi:ribose transport system permease protein